MIIAPVSIINKPTFINQFQTTDFLSLQGVTIGSFGLKKPILCNGANLAYRKPIFNELNGFIGNEKIASGDDVFLLEKFVSHAKERVIFANNYDALVYTKPINNWYMLCQQRKRWAAKSKYYTNNYTKLLGLLVLLTNYLIIIALFFLYKYTFICSIILLLKWTVDSILIFKTAKNFKEKIPVKFYIKTTLFYPFFTVYIAFLSLVSSFSWKGRIFKA